MESILFDDADDGDEYGTEQPEDPTSLHIDGKSYDLSDPKQAEEALERTREYRRKYKDGELDEYEGHSTKYRGGGRARLLYDEVRAEEAVKYHQGKSNLTWAEQHTKAQEVVKIRAKIVARGR